MSLILEALKRSEAERRQGSDGDPLPEFTMTSNNRRWMPWLVAMIAVVTLVVAARSWFNQDAANAPTDSPDIATTVEQIETPMPPEPEPEPEPATGNNTESSEAEAGTAPIDNPEPDTQSVEARPIHSPAVVPPIIEPSVARDETLVSLPVASEEPPAPTVTVDLTEPVEPVADNGNTDAGQQTRLPHLGQLPPATRQAIGELTLNIHVFDEQVSARFVLINLRRYHELDQLTDELQVKRIQADGVVLEFRGAPFLLPARN